MANEHEEQSSKLNSSNNTVDSIMKFLQENAEQSSLATEDKVGGKCFIDDKSGDVLDVAGFKADLDKEIEEEFSSEGIFKDVPRYAPRPGQIAMAKQIAYLINGVDNTKNKLLVEAGTGIGKTFAYLVPILAAKKHAVISTDSLALQDQLYFKDIKTVQAKLGCTDLKVSKLKGLSNYICLHKLQSIFADCAAKLLIVPESQNACLKSEYQFFLSFIENGEEKRISSYDNTLPTSIKKSSKVKEDETIAELGMLNLSRKSNSIDLESFQDDTNEARIAQKKKEFSSKNISHFYSYRTLSAIVDYLNNDPYGETGELRKHFEELGEEFPLTLEADISITRLHCQFADRDDTCKNSCLAKLARNKAKNSDVLIMNHAMFCNGATSPTEFFPQNIDVCVFDECHKLPDRVRDAFTVSLEKNSLQFLLSHIHSKLIKTCVPVCKLDFSRLQEPLIKFFIQDNFSRLLEVVTNPPKMIIRTLKTMMTEFCEEPGNAKLIKELITGDDIFTPLYERKEGEKDSSLVRFEAVRQSFIKVVLLTVRVELEKVIARLKKNHPNDESSNLIANDIEQIKKAFISQINIFFMNATRGKKSATKHQKERSKIMAGQTINLKDFTPSGKNKERPEKTAEDQEGFEIAQAKFIFNNWFETLFEAINDFPKCIDNINTDNDFNLLKNFSYDSCTTRVEPGKSEEDFMDNLEQNVFEESYNFIKLFVDFINVVNLMTFPESKSEGEVKTVYKTGFLDNIPLDCLKDIYEAFLLVFPEVMQDKAKFDKQKQYRWYRKDSEGGFELNVSSFNPGNELHSYVLDSEVFARTKFIFTSATVRTSSGANAFDISANGFESFIKSLSLIHQKLVCANFKSPFDYEHNALLCIPDAINREMAAKDKISILAPTIAMCHGGVFILCTSNNQVKMVAYAIKENYLLKNRKLFVQGEQFGKNQMIANFKHVGNAILVGTKSFWEGVDISGRALSMVIIDKLPFPGKSIDISATEKYFRQELKINNTFGLVQVPRALVDLKQGIGRLIRSVNDKGVIIICAPTLLWAYRKSYSKTFWEALSDFKRTESLTEANDFLKKITQESCDDDTDDDDFQKDNDKTDASIRS